MSDIKLLRKQLRNVVQEALPELLTAELTAAIKKDVTAQMEARMTAIAKHIQQTLDALDQRSKDVQSYVIRETSKK